MKTSYTRSQLETVKDTAAAKIEEIHNMMCELDLQLEVYREDIRWAVAELAALEAKGE